MTEEAEKINAKVSETIKLGDKTYKIVGIYNETNIVDLPSVLTFDRDISGNIININNFTLTKPSYKYFVKYLPKNEYDIVLGNEITSSDECLVHVDSNLEIGQNILGYRVVGIYNKNYESGTANNKYMYDNIIITDGYYLVNNRSYDVVFKINDVSKDVLKENGFKVYDLSDYQRVAIRKHHMEDNIALLIVSLFFIGASILLTFLTNRSRIINEIKTIGVYRSIGKSRKCLIYQKLGYNLLMTSISTIIGYSIAWIFNAISNNLSKAYQEVIPANPLMIILGVIVLYLIGLFIGLLPTKSLIKKTPAEINSKYDI